DITKGVLPVLLLPGLAIPGVGHDPLVTREWLVYACGGAAIFGHCYPVWYEFAGGKGAATALGVLAAAAPVVVLPSMITWFAMLYTVGFVGLATVVATAVVPVFLAITAGAEAANLIVFTSALALFIAFTHRSNLRKLVLGGATPDVSNSLLNRQSQKSR
ncbi:MAG: glycerol-3-phosphate acyltransferase, partial [Gammaproteobacteria bacterium]|nr:glycerol-3-phosphate acyltransferase [Gammaproteobacteria bacterium]